MVPQAQTTVQTGPEPRPLLSGALSLPAHDLCILVMHTSLPPALWFPLAVSSGGQVVSPFLTFYVQGLPAQGLEPRTPHTCLQSQALNQSWILPRKGPQ
jgi:hypothetical protein